MRQTSGEKLMPVRFSRLVGIMFAASACASAGARVSQPAREPLEPQIAVASFDSLWSIVHRTHVDTAFVASKWARVRDSLRPRALSATSRQELDELLADALHTIPESHFYIIPASIAQEKQTNG